MSDIVITAENLSKSYLVGHRSSQRESYTSLRDVIARGARSFGCKALDFVHGRQVVQGDEVEEFWALRDVSFELKRGKVLGIIGRNGAGKSTLLKILSRITEPSRGCARLRGRVASLLEVGTGFHPELTGRENIFLNGAILGMTKAEIKSKFDEIVDFAEVGRFLDTPVKRYSTGMYVRLAFSIAAHLEPEILIVDEVLAVGDADFQKRCLGKMQDVASKEGRTILFVSHNMAAIESMCDSALLLVRGRCAAQGDVQVVLQEYLRDISRASAVPLEDRTDRSGTGAVRFVSISLEDHNGSKVSAFQCGTKAILHLIVENRTQDELRGLRISLGIDNEMGQRVALLDTMLLGEDISGGAAVRQSVRVVIPRMALIPGRYRLTIFSTLSRVLADSIENAATFDVDAGDFYGTGHLMLDEQGMFLLDHHFVLSNDQSDLGIGSIKGIPSVGLCDSRSRKESVG
jgi:lipopolysaccharide transport system ATP-binding protein